MSVYGKFWYIIAFMVILTTNIAVSEQPPADANKVEGKLKVASCQFPVSGDANSNAEYIKKYIRQAAENKADVIQFCEGALSGYAGCNFSSFEGYDWNALRGRTHEIMSLAKQCHIWVILGSSHYIAEDVKPTNCLYIISDQGEIVERYDKSMCTPTDLKYYTPGDRRVTVTLKGIKCGFLICYDICYPAMYNVYKHMDVELMFHSFHNASYDGPNILDEIKPAWIRARAADYQMWVVATNSSAKHSCWATCIASPAGAVVDSLQRHEPGVLYHEFPDKDYKGWLHTFTKMKLAENDIYHTGTPSNHPRATNPQAQP
jgi:deaminated glutathione amidase